MFPNNIQQRVERSIFEVLRKLIVGQGYLPDITDTVNFPIDDNGRFTQLAQTNWDTALKTIKTNLGWAVEIFGCSSAFAKGLKASPRVVIISKRIIPGDIGLPPGSVYNYDQVAGDYIKSDYPPESSNMHFDIHLISSTQEQSRFLNALLSVGLAHKKYLQFEDNADERFFIKHYNYYDVSDTSDGLEENVYSYEVQDLYLFAELNESRVKPITEINTDIIIGYNTDNNGIPIPENPVDTPITMKVN